MVVEVKQLDGVDTLFIKGRALESHEVVRAIGQGANGVVFLTQNKLLGRREAVKVWHSARPDRRDKLEQGLAEARKLALANKDFAVEIYSLQVFEGVPMAAMEFIDGSTLREVHARRPKSLELARLAFMYLEAVEGTCTRETVHGDPHLSNVMVYEQDQIPMGTQTRVKLCDFGTSRFSSKGFSTDRHWRIVEQTVLKLTEGLEGAEAARARLPEFRAKVTGINFDNPPELFSGTQLAQMRNIPLREYLRSLKGVYGSA